MISIHIHSSICYLNVVLRFLTPSSSLCIIYCCGVRIKQQQSSGENGNIHQILRQEDATVLMDRCCSFDKVSGNGLNVYSVHIWRFPNPDKFKVLQSVQRWGNQISHYGSTFLRVWAQFWSCGSAKAQIWHQTHSCQRFHTIPLMYRARNLYSSGDTSTTPVIMLCMLSNCLLSGQKKSSTCCSLPPQEMQF